MSTEAKQEGVREDPDLEQKHMENLNDLVPDDVTPPDLCNYSVIGTVKHVICYDSGPVLTKWQDGMFVKPWAKRLTCISSNGL